MAGRRGSSSPPCGWRQTRLMGSSGRRLKICPVRPLPPLPASTAQQWRHRLALPGRVSSAASGKGSFTGRLL